MQLLGYRSMLLTCSFSRMEIFLSLWTSPCNAMAVTPSQLHPFHITFLLATLPLPHTLQQLFTEHQRAGGRVVGVTLHSPISAPFLVHYNTFPLSIFGAGKHLRLFSVLKSPAKFTLIVLILSLLSSASKMLPLLILHPFLHS